ncbi:hypothetical protein DXG01_008276 [Tephrocybe rancida]|nr:hypothetical protein DXG01_008276 [Tephrocybe rancida]
MKRRSEEQPRSAPQRIPQRARPSEENAPGQRDEVEAAEAAERRADRRILESEEARRAEAESWNGTRSSWKEPAPRLTKHLRALFPELRFPDEVAKRILTHGSHPSAIYGHNGAFQFVGRRVMESYLLLMLNSSKSLRSTPDIDEVVARTLNSYTLGETVGSNWGLGRAMRWTPSVAARLLKKGADQRELLRAVGLYKIQGDAVSAIMGGVFFQFGGSVAHRLFHTRILPQLIQRGLPAAFENDARSVCASMGGEKGRLLPPKPTTEPAS